MTHDEIRAAIAADPALQAMQADGNLQGIATALTATLPPVKLPTEIGPGTVLELLGMDGGNAFLDMIDSVPAFRHVKKLVDRSALRLDLPATEAQLLQMVADNVLPQAAANALLTRVQTTPAAAISWEQVHAAIEGNE